MLGLCLPNVNDYVRSLIAQGVETDDAVLIEILCTRSYFELVKIKDTFKKSEGLIVYVSYRASLPPETYTCICLHVCMCMWVHCLTC